MSDVKIVFSADTAATLQAVQRMVGGVTSFMQGLAASVAAGFSVHAIVEFIDRQIEAADEAGKTAQKIGTSAESYSAYAYAASLADVTTGEFAIGMKTLASQVVAAANGQTDFGVRVKNTDGTLRKLDEILPEIADKFAGMENGIRKTDLATQLFGRSGGQLIPLLNDGAAGLEKLRAEALAAGVVISGDTAKSAEEFNDTLTRVRAQVAGLGLALAEQLLPYLQQGANALKEFTSSAEKKRTAVVAVIEVLKGLALIVVTVTAAVLTLARQVGANLALIFVTLTDTVTAASKEFRIWFSVLGEGAERVLRLGLSLGNLGTMLRALATGDFKGATAAAQKFQDDAGSALKDLGTTVGRGLADTGEATKAYFKQAGGNISRWAAETKDNVLSNWNLVGETYKKLFGPAAPAEPRAESKPRGSDGEASDALKKETQGMLDSINEAYRQSAFSKARILEQDYAEQLRQLHSRLMDEKHLTAEQLQSDEDYLLAKYQLDKTYATKRADLDRESATAKLGVDLGGNDLAQQKIRGDGSLTEDEKLQALIPLLAERNRLLEEGVALNSTFLDLSDASEEKELEVKGRINGLLRQQLDIQQEVADKERDINAKRLTGVHNMFSNMAAAAKAFGREGLAAYKAFAIAAAVIDTASAAIAAYKAVVGIPYVGPILAPIAAAAAIAAGAAQISAISSQSYAEGGLVIGPGSGTSDSIPARLSNGEFVISAAAAARNRSLLEDINAGVFNARARTVAPVLTSSSASIDAEAPGLRQPGGSGAAANVNVAAPEVHVVVVKGEAEAIQYLESQAGKNTVLRHVRENKGEAGFDA